MIPIGSLGARLRSFFKAREYRQRRLPRRSCKPRVGTHVVNAHQNRRLVVEAGMSDELWKWLMDQGWRVETYSPDRRRYLDIPASWVIALIDAEPSFREEVLARAALSAQPRVVPARIPN